MAERSCDWGWGICYAHKSRQPKFGQNFKTKKAPPKLEAVKSAWKTLPQPAEM